MPFSQPFSSLFTNDVIPSTLNYSTLGDFESFYFSNPSTNAGNKYHVHQFYELMLVMRGNVSVAINGQLYSVPEGSIVIIPPNILHCSIVSATSFNYERIVLHFMPFFYSQFLKDYSINTNNLFKEITIFKCSSIDTATYRLLFERLIIESHNSTPEDPYSHSIQKAIIDEILLRLCRDNNKPTVPSHSASNLIAKVIAHIDDNYQNHCLSLEQIARDNYVSSGYLLKIFRKYTGTTVYQYIIQVRLSHAQTLLLENKTVLDSCLESGFQDYASFFKAFKNNYHCTPKQFQLLAKEASEKYTSMRTKISPDIDNIE